MFDTSSVNVGFWFSSGSSSIKLERPRTAFKTKTETKFLVSDRSCPKTDGLRPHHLNNGAGVELVCFMLVRPSSMRPYDTSTACSIPADVLCGVPQLIGPRTDPIPSVHRRLAAACS